MVLPTDAKVGESRTPRQLPTDLRWKARATRNYSSHARLLRESNEDPYCLYASNWSAARLTEYIHHYESTPFDTRNPVSKHSLPEIARFARATAFINIHVTLSIELSS